jgi:hypothetical protein
MQCLRKSSSGMLALSPVRWQTFKRSRRLVAVGLATLLAPIAIVTQAQPAAASTTIFLRGTSSGDNCSLGCIGGVTLSNPGATAGDLLLAIFVTLNGASSTTAAFLGWKSMANGFSENGGSGAVIYYRVAGSSEPSTYLFSSGGGIAQAALLDYGGVNPNEPIRDLSTSNGLLPANRSTTVLEPGVATGMTGVVQVAMFVGSLSNNGFSTPSGMSARISRQTVGSTAILNAGGLSLGVFDGEVASTAGSGPVTSSTTSSAAAGWSSFGIALQPTTAPAADVSATGNADGSVLAISGTGGALSSTVALSLTGGAAAPTDASLVQDRADVDGMNLIDNTGVADTADTELQALDSLYVAPLAAVENKIAIVERAAPEIAWRLADYAAGTPLPVSTFDLFCWDGSNCWLDANSVSQPLTNEQTLYTCGPAASRLILWQINGVDPGEGLFGARGGPKLGLAKLEHTDYHGTVILSIPPVMNRRQTLDAFFHRKPSDLNEYMSMVTGDVDGWWAGSPGHGLINNVNTKSLSFWGGHSAKHYDVSYGYDYFLQGHIDIAEEWNPTAVGVSTTKPGPNSYNGHNPYGEWREPITNVWTAVHASPTQLVVW